MIFQDYIYELLGFGIGAGLSFAFHEILKSGIETTKLLTEAAEYNIDHDLIKKVDSLGNVVGCFYGAVKAEQNPIHSIHRPEITGVIWKQTIKEHIVTQIMGLWMTDEKIIDETTRSVPFSICGNGISIQVCTPSQLEHVDLSIVSENFEAANFSLAHHLLFWIKGIQTTGTKYTEEMLVQGARVIGIGKVISSSGNHLLKPFPPLPFILTTKDKEAVIRELEGPMTFFRFFKFVTACGALYFLLQILHKLHKRWEDIQHKRKIDRVLQEAKLRRATNQNDLPESLMCVICSELRDIVLVPCKHVCVCSECYLKLEEKLCPVCRTKIQTIEPVFYS